MVNGIFKFMSFTRNNNVTYIVMITFYCNSIILGTEIIALYTRMVKRINVKNYKMLQEQVCTFDV